VNRNPERDDIQVVLVPANEIAEELGNERLANLVLLGALLDRLDVLSIEQVSEGLKGHIPAHRRNLLEANIEALRRGAELSKEQLEPA
jgi:2-oxoglutarate ferredoxin oxidoreductase subunit gamma